MKDSLDSIQQQLGEPGSHPALDQWQPDLSGDIDIVIDRRGDWYHEGGKIERDELVKLFLSILRREDDGEFYLVTPVEKWRIQVEDAPLLVTDVDVTAPATAEQSVSITLSNGGKQTLSKDMALRITIDKTTGEPAPYIDLPHGLFAKFTRSMFYHLINDAELRGNEMGISSGGTWMVIGQLDEDG